MLWNVYISPFVCYASLFQETVPVRLNSSLVQRLHQGVMCSCNGCNSSTASNTVLVCSIGSNSTFMFCSCSTGCLISQCANCLDRRCTPSLWRCREFT